MNDDPTYSKRAHALNLAYRAKRAARRRLLTLACDWAIAVAFGLFLGWMAARGIAPG